MSTASLMPDLKTEASTPRSAGSMSWAEEFENRIRTGIYKAEQQGPPSVQPTDDLGKVLEERQKKDHLDDLELSSQSTQLLKTYLALLSGEVANRISKLRQAGRTSIHPDEVFDVDAVRNVVVIHTKTKDRVQKDRERLGANQPHNPDRGLETLAPEEIMDKINGLRDLLSLPEVSVGTISEVPVNGNGHERDYPELPS